MGHRAVRPLRAGRHRAGHAARRRRGAPAATRRRAGIALALDGNGRFAKLDPHDGAQLALAEAYRNVACTGATPLAVTDCLNFGSPEDPAVMWQFAEATRGLAEACRVLGTPVTGGNVSFYNQTGATAINPTPVIGVLGVIDDVAHRVPSGFRRAGAAHRAARRDRRRARRLGVGVGRARPPRRSPAHGPARRPSRRSPDCWCTPREHHLISAAHDLSEGGLAQALVEAALINGIGADRLG